MLESQFIKKLQEKPEPVKKAIMWTSVLVIMVVIFSFWLWNFSNQISETTVADNLSESMSSFQKLPGIWQSFKSQFENLTQLFSK